MRSLGRKYREKYGINKQMIFAERVKIGTRDIKVELKKHHGNSQENQKMDHPT